MTDPDPEMPLAALSSHREFFDVAVGVLTVLFGGVAAVPVINDFWQRLSAVTPSRTRESASHFLFRNSENCFDAASKDNPYSQIRGMTPPTADALSSTLAILGVDKAAMRGVETLCTPRLDGSAIFFGGPVANVHSRQILGIGKGSPLLSRSEGKRVILPFQFGNVLLPHPSPAHRPDYQIISDTARYVPGPADDFLLVTSLPNVFSPGYGILTDHRLMIFAGLHGQGSRAIKLLLERPKTLEEIENEAKDFAGWQTLFRVTRGSGDWPTEISKITPVREIKVDFDRTRRLVEGTCYWLDPDDEFVKI